MGDKEKMPNVSTLSIQNNYFYQRIGNNLVTVNKRLKLGLTYILYRS
jgi:hypothetical protein